MNALVLGWPNQLSKNIRWDQLEALSGVGVKYFAPAGRDELNLHRHTITADDYHEGVWQWELHAESDETLFEEGGLIVLRSPAPAGWLQIKTERQSTNYRQFSPEEFEGEFFGRCYRQTEDAPNYSEEKIITVEVAHRSGMKVDAARVFGWVNPFLLRVECVGEPIGEFNHEAESFIKTLLANCILECVPLLSPGSRDRQEFLVNMIGEDSHESFSTMERVHFGGLRNRAFLALDELDGRFFVCEHGSGTPALYWQFPEAGSLSRWGAILADRWVKEWGGSAWGKAGLPEGRIPLAETLSGLGAPVQIELSKAELQNCQDCPVALIRKLQSAGIKNRTLDKMALSLEKMSLLLEKRQLIVHRRALTPQTELTIGKIRVVVDIAVLVESLGEYLLRPRSAVWVDFSIPTGLPSSIKVQVEQALGRCPDHNGGLRLQQWLDPWNTPAFAARRYTQSFLEQLGQPRATDRTLLFTSGWWSEWLETFFTDASAIKVMFVEVGCFLDDSQLDHMYLGGEVANYRQSSFVRF